MCTILYLRFPSHQLWRRSDRRSSAEPDGSRRLGAKPDATYGWPTKGSGLKGVKNRAIINFIESDTVCENLDRGYTDYKVIIQLHPWQTIPCNGVLSTE